MLRDTVFNLRIEISFAYIRELRLLMDTGWETHYKARSYFSHFTQICPVAIYEIYKIV